LLPNGEAKRINNTSSNPPTDTRQQQWGCGLVKRSPTETMSGKKNSGPMDDDMDTMETANLITNPNNNAAKSETEIPLCGCMSVRYYQPV
jgi:hypothetical protein